MLMLPTKPRVLPSTHWKKPLCSLLSHRFIGVWITHIKHSHQATKLPSQSAYELTSLRGRLHLSSWRICWSFLLYWLMNWHTQCSSTLVCIPLIYSTKVGGCKPSDADSTSTWQTEMLPSEESSSCIPELYIINMVAFTLPAFSPLWFHQTASLPEPNPQLL